MMESRKFEVPWCLCQVWILAIVLYLSGKSLRKFLQWQSETSLQTLGALCFVPMQTNKFSHKLCRLSKALSSNHSAQVVAPSKRGSRAPTHAVPPSFCILRPDLHHVHCIQQASWVSPPSPRRKQINQSPSSAGFTLRGTWG